MEHLEMEHLENEQPTKKRSPGGQPGNRNATKHGLYSRLLLPDEKKCLNGNTLGRLDDEITLLRGLIYRTIKSFNENPPIDFSDHLKALRAVTLAIGCLQGLIRTQKDIYNDGRYTMEDAIQLALTEVLSTMPLYEDED